MGFATLRRRVTGAIGAGCFTVIAVIAVTAPALAAQQQPGVVATQASALMPRLVATRGEPGPRVNAFADLGQTMIAGGSFRAVEQNSSRTRRTNLVAFNRTTGRVSTTFSPAFTGGQIWALAADASTNSVYVGGRFTAVDGVSRAALAKVDATTGALDPAFVPTFTGGQINDVQLIEVGGVKHLVIAGTPARKVMSLNPATGRDDRWIRLQVTDALPGSGAGASGSRIAINGDATRMVVTGNFTRVDDQARSRLFVADLSASGARLSPWYYPGFAKSCTDTSRYKIAYLAGVDWSPDGRFFSVAATGNVPRSSSDIWYHRLGDANRPDTAVCDGVGRFELADPTKPEWVNYTGGDTVWTVIDTGAAVYAAGHFRYLDNPDGFSSQPIGDRTSGRPAVRRQGLGAIDPTTGLALRWNPSLGQTRRGGRDFLADPTGLWIGNDATTFAGEPRRGLQYAMLPR